MATIDSGEIHPERETDPRERVTRSRVDKSSFLIAGNRMSHKLSDCRVGADPPKNESGKVGTSSRYDNDKASSSSISAGKGSLIVASSSNNEVGAPSIKILHTRSCRLSTEMTSVTLGS